MPDRLQLLRDMARRVREDWIDSGVAVDVARERHDNLRRELLSLERQIADQERESASTGE